jgi:hypothetical protein
MGKLNQNGRNRIVREIQSCWIMGRPDPRIQGGSPTASNRGLKQVPRELTAFEIEAFFTVSG